MPGHVYPVGRAFDPTFCNRTFADYDSPGNEENWSDDDIRNFKH